MANMAQELRKREGEVIELPLRGGRKLKGKLLKGPEDSAGMISMNLPDGDITFPFYELDAAAWHKQSGACMEY